MWSGYKVHAFVEALPIVVLLIGCSAIYFGLSKNTNMLKRIMVSSHCLIFIIAEIFAVFASDYYERGHWNNGEYVPTDMGSALGNVQIGLFILGLMAIAYSLWRFKGDKRTHILILPILILAGFLYLLAGMTLSHDWM